MAGKDGTNKTALSNMLVILREMCANRPEKLDTRIMHSKIQSGKVVRQCLQLDGNGKSAFDCYFVAFNTAAGSLSTEL